MTEKQFKIMKDCGDYHLLNGDEQLCYDLCSPTMRKTNWNNVVDKLNEQDNRIKSKERVIKAYEDYIKTLKEDGDV